MPLFKLRETFSSGKSHSLKVPATDEATALGIGQALLDGEIEVIEEPADVTSSVASVTAVSYNRFDIVGKNTTGDKTYFSFLGKSTVSDLDVRNYFLNKTINGVHLDDVIVSVKVYTV